MKAGRKLQVVRQKRNVLLSVHKNSTGTYYFYRIEDKTLPRVELLQKRMNKEAMLLIREDKIPLQDTVHAEINKFSKYKRGIHGTMLYTIMMINSYIWPDI